ncbi:hypothetical protein [Enterococcus wangshanyuanii]|uniref:Uncharacterized protein n=1 Tax=Enterococcus wangshanyuanii TaxID=2005703 RepID=A0ABQ1PRK6_9ENTE|nr:hypothetical protein [Enterococcus wangshanyuanii]GGD02217.1 hypothetical protein GCM10011573_34640 [Enterococcus wangshanyuanii]
MQNYITIYGDMVTGEIVSIYENTAIVRTAKGGHHMIHKDSLDKNCKAKRGKNRLGISGGFDLASSQSESNRLRGKNIAKYSRY